MRIGTVVKHLRYNDDSDAALVIRWQEGAWDDGFVPVDVAHLVNYPVGSEVAVSVTRVQDGKTV